MGRTSISRKKRLLVLLGGVTALAAIGGGAVYLRRVQIDHEAFDARTAGRAAAAAGDWPAALDGIGRFLGRFPDRGATAEDFILYARARRNCPLPNSRHLVDAAPFLRRALELEPGRADARSDLLDLYLATGCATEALDLIEAALPTSPADLKLLRTKRDVLGALRRHPEAIKTALRVNELSPGDLGDAFSTLYLLFASDKPAAEVDAWVDATIAARPQDARLELLRASVLNRRGDAEKAKQVLDHVVEACKTQNDPTFVEHLLEQFDAAGRYADSLRILGRLDDTASPRLLVERLRRLWYAGRIDQITAASASWVPPAFGSDPEVLAIRILALRTAGRPDDAGRVREELDRQTDDAAVAWRSAVADRTYDAKSLGTTLAAMRTAVESVKGSAILRQSLGDAYAAIGETELAMEAWKAAAARAPAWAAPLHRVAEAYLASGRVHLATAAARAALERAPNDAASVSALIRAASAASAKLDPRQMSALLAATAAFRKDVHSRNDELLPIQVGLLLQTDRAAAEACIREALQADPAPSEMTLLRLARIAASASVPLEDGLLERSEQAHGTTAALALYRSIERARKSGGAEGLKLLAALRSRAAARDTDLDWDMARPMCLDAIRSTDGGAAWIACADAHPDALGAQLGAIGSPTSWNDREAMKRIIDRVESMTGETATTWRVARARWLMNGPAPAESEIAEAAALLNAVIRVAPDDTSARMLNAQALEKLGNLPAAQDQLRAASELAKDDTSIALEIARVSQAQGDLEGARRQLDRVLAAADLEPAQVERAAWLLAVSGDRQRSAAILEPLASRAGTPREGVMRLAQMYAALGRHERAIELCERVMDDPDPQVVELAAGLYTAVGRKVDAEKLLRRLDLMQAPDGERELVRARYASRWGPPGTAADWYRKALDAGPGRADTWTSYLAYTIAAGDAAELTAILDDPRAAAVEPVRFLSSVRSVCVTAMADARLRPLLSAAIEDKAGRPALVEAVQTIGRDWSEPAKRSATAQGLRRLADSNPRVLYLQIIAAELSGDVTDLPAACEISRRAMAQFPNSAPAAWQAAELLAKSNRWADALEAGLAWNDRSPSQDLRPDAFVARAMLRLGRTPGALAVLEPQIGVCLANPEDHQDMILTYAVAQVRAASPARAAEVLADLVRTSDAWRTRPLSVQPVYLGDARTAETWLELCAANVPSGDAAARLALARAWIGAWEEFRAPSLEGKAKQAAASVTAVPDASAASHFAAALLAQQTGDLEAAIRGYRLVLAKDAKFADARNNLAMALANSGHGREAVEEATKAVEAQPGNAAYLDTLAFAQRKAGDFAKAAESLAAAIKLQPLNPEWRVSLAETLTESGRSDAAAVEVARIDEMVSRGARMNRDTRGRFDRLRTNPR